MLIRRACRDDIRPLYDFDVARAGGREPSYSLEKWRSHVLKDAVYAVFSDKNPVAFVHLVKGKDNDMLLNDLYVDESRRGLGWGRKLLESALAVVDTQVRNSVIYVDKNNEGAIRLYRSFGFEDSPDQVFDIIGIRSLERKAFAHIFK